MTQQQRNLIDGYAGKQQLYSEGIAEHVGVAPLPRAVGLLDAR